nr:hypothetical protein CFP56_76019 [Quercus suber]
MALRRAKRGKSKAASEPEVVFDQLRGNVSKALDIPIIRTPTYPYSRSSRIDNFMDVLCGRPVIQGSDRSISSNEDMHGDPIVAVVEDGDDEVDVDIATTVHTGPPPPSLRAMMEAVMTTQASHGQLLDGLLAEVAALRADLADYSRPVPPSPPSDS